MISCRSSRTRTRSSVSSRWRTSASSSAYARARIGCSASASGPRWVSRAAATAGDSAGTRSRSASTRPATIAASGRSAAVTVYQAHGRSSAQLASSVDLPKPASAVIVTSLRRAPSSRSSVSRCRGIVPRGTARGTAFPAERLPSPPPMLPPTPTPRGRATSLVEHGPSRLRAVSVVLRTFGATGARRGGGPRRSWPAGAWRTRSPRPCRAPRRSRNRPGIRRSPRTVRR